MWVWPVTGTTRASPGGNGPTSVPTTETTTELAVRVGQDGALVARRTAALPRRCSYLRIDPDDYAINYGLRDLDYTWAKHA